MISEHRSKKYILEKIFQELFTKFLKEKTTGFLSKSLNVSNPTLKKAKQRGKIIKTDTFLELFTYILNKQNTIKNCIEKDESTLKIHGHLSLNSIKTILKDTILSKFCKKCSISIFCINRIMKKNTLSKYRECDKSVKQLITQRIIINYNECVTLVDKIKKIMVKSNNNIYI